MGVSNNSPTFSYVHFSGVSVVYNNELYMVQDYATNKKYIYYNVDLPNQLNSSNVMPNRSMKQFLVAVNDNGMATLVPSTSDDFSISFDGNSTQAIKDRIFGLYEKNEEFGEKFIAIEQDIDGIRQMVGSGGTGGSGYDDSEVWEKFSQIEQTVDNIDLSVKETVKKYNDDKETNKLREDLNSSIIKINANLGTFKSEITDYFKNNEITEEEKVKIETQLGILENEKAALDGIVDTVKLIAENSNKTQDVVAIESAKNALNIAHNNLKNNITNAIIDSIITTTEVTIVIDSFAKYNLRINELKNTCDDIIILGLGGVITEELSSISMKTDEIKLSVSRIESDFKNDMSVQKIQLENQINDVNAALGTFEEIVNTTFKDGIIEESEKQLLKEKIELIDKEKVDIDVRYNSLIEDVYLSESIKSELINKYESYNLKHDELKSKIELVISDNMINDAEALEINTLFKQYSNSLAYCSAIMAKAIEDISFNMSKAELEQAKNELRNEIDDVKDSIGEIGGVIDGTFEDNILDEVERRDIQQNLENLSREKIDIDNTFNNLYNNKYLDSENKNKFKSIYDDYINAYNEVISVSNGILNKETLIDNVDRANLNSAILEHNDKLNLFSIEINRIMDVISLSQSNSFKDEVQKDISDVNDRIDDVLGDIDGAVADSVIDKAEAVIIRESLDIIEKEKLDVDARYETVYGNSFLSGSAKSNLLNAKENFDLSTTDLIKIITSSIEDERVTENELTSINEKRDSYKNNSAVLNTRFQEAIDYITKAQVDKAKLDFDKEISDLGGVIEDLENTMNGVFHDGILTEVEKLSINQHLLTLSSEKSDIDKQYQTIYSNTYLEGQEKTNLNTAYNNYVTAYNSLVSVIDGIVKKEGLVDSTDRNNLNNSFKNHNEKLGLYTVSATNALDFIAKKKAEVESEKIDKKYAEIIIDLEAGITSRVEHINTQLNGDGGINQRLQSAEEKITSEGITQIVKDIQYIKDMDGKISTNKSNISKVEQTASKISSTVSDLSGRYTELTQTVNGLTSTVAGKVDSSSMSSIIQQSPKDIQIGFNGINDTVLIDSNKMQFKDSAGNQSLSFMRGSLYAYEPNSSVFMGAGLIPRWNQGLYNAGFGILAGANSYYYSIARANSWEADTQANPGSIDEYFIINYRDRGNDLSKKQGCHTYYKLYTSGGINGMGYDIENFTNIKCLDLYAGTIRDTNGSTILTTNGSSMASNKDWNFNYYTLSNAHLSNASLNTSQDCSVGSISTYTYKGSNGTTLFTSASTCSNRVGWAWNNNNLLDPVIIGGSYGYSITPNTATYSNAKTYNGDVNLDGILDKINIYPARTTYETARTTYETDLATCKTNSEISLEVDVTELKQSESADMFIKRYDTVNSETGESEIVENIDMKSLLHLALLEIKNLKKEVKALKMKVGV